MLKNVLIITQSFPPLGNIAAQRFGFLAPYLQQYGWRPWVLTTDCTGPLQVHIPDGQIIRIGRHPQAEMRINNTASGPCEDLSPSWGRVRGALRHARLQFRAVDRTNLTWFPEVVRREAALRRRLPKIDMVVGTFGPAATLWLARRFARAMRAPWVADYRDLAALRHDDRNAVSRGIDLAVERHLLRTAAGLTTVSNTLAEILARQYRRRAKVVYNGWDVAQPPSAGLAHVAQPPSAGLAHVAQPPSAGLAGVPLLRRSSAAHVSGAKSTASAKQWHTGMSGNTEKQDMPTASVGMAPNGIPYLYYAGRLYGEQIPAAVIIMEALARQCESHFVLRSLGPPELDARLRREATRLDLSDRVHLLPPCDPATVDAEARAALANVVLSGLDRRHPWDRGTLTGKFLQLVALRPPVLSVARSDSDMGPILERTQKGEVCSTAGEIHEFLTKTIRRTPSALGGNPREVERFSKRRQAGVFCRFLDELVCE